MTPRFGRPRQRPSAEIGPEANAAIPPLVELVKDGDIWVRQSGGWALERIGTSAVPALTELLKDKNPDVRRVAVPSSVILAPRPTAALPALTALHQDANPFVRRSAAKAVRMIQNGKNKQ